MVIKSFSSGNGWMSGWKGDTKNRRVKKMIPYGEVVSEVDILIHNHAGYDDEKLYNSLMEYRKELQDRGEEISWEIWNLLHYTSKILKLQMVRNEID